MSSLVSAVRSWLRAPARRARPDRPRTTLGLEDLEGRWAPSSIGGSGGSPDLGQSIQQMQAEFQREIQVEFQQLNTFIQSSLESFRHMGDQLQSQLHDQLEHVQESQVEVEHEVEHEVGDLSHGGLAHH